jgi:flagellar biosynthesis protein FlhF
MKIKRFTAGTMREAIRMVREEQGPDAVILSNRRVPNGVEVVAATDYDAALAQQALRQQLPPDPPPRPTPPPAAPPRQSSQKSMATVRRKSEADAGALAGAGAAAEATATTLKAQPLTESRSESKTELALMQSELGNMRRLLEEQLSGLFWNEMKRSQPRRVAMLRVLAALGLDAGLARSIADEVPAQGDPQSPAMLAQGLLARRILVAPQDPILDGGVVAMVGPTGVGKTTTIAKLAARFIQHNRPRDVALVTMDHYRIGAQEQLYGYARLLGVPVHNIAPDQSLGALLDRLGDHRLVLIDSAGMSQRDGTLAQQIERLRGLGQRVRSHVVIAADCGNPQQVLERFAGVKPVACILTKLDEASSIGAALSAAIRQGLPFSYVTHGQRVPEDLHLAHADRLALCAARLARTAPKLLDDEGLSLRYATHTPEPRPIHA